MATITTTFNLIRGVAVRLRGRIGGTLTESTEIQVFGAKARYNATTKRAEIDTGLVDVREYFSSGFDPSTDDCHDVLVSADAAAAAADSPLQVPTLCLVGANLTFGGHVHFQRGGMLKPASGVTITMATYSVDDDLQQCFDLSDGGTVVLV